MPAAMESLGVLKVDQLPVDADLALSGMTAPLKHLMSVDLPAPLSPMTPSTSPG